MTEQKMIDTIINEVWCEDAIFYTMTEREFQKCLAEKALSFASLSLPLNASEEEKILWCVDKIEGFIL